jgi:hypothetical protein
MWRFEEADEPPIDTTSAKDGLDARVMPTESETGHRLTRPPRSVGYFAR